MSKFTECANCNSQWCAVHKECVNQPMTTTDPKLIERIARAAELMVLAAGVIRDHASDAIRHYDGADCDGYCLSDDLETAAELLPTAAAINEAAHQWQDIATAPRDWDDVLVFSPEHEHFNCGGVFSAFYDPDAGKWATHGPFANIELQPTYWQHLPSPPAIEAKESQHGA